MNREKTWAREDSLQLHPCEHRISSTITKRGGLRWRNLVPFSTGSWRRNSWPTILFASFHQDDIGNNICHRFDIERFRRERRERSSTVFNVIEGITSLLRWWTTTSRRLRLYRVPNYWHEIVYRQYYRFLLARISVITRTGDLFNDVRRRRQCGKRDNNGDEGLYIVYKSLAG